MAKSVLDILIKLSKQGNADKQVEQGLFKLKAAFSDASITAGALVAAGYAVKKALDATVGTMVAYADQVRSVQQSTGMSAEESSKLIQVLDDMKVSYDELQKVIQKNGDQFDYSVEGLAKMSDEYRSLTDAQDKAKYMQERFGKGWVSFVETMEQGGNKIRAAGDDVNQGLILDQEAVNSAREYEKSLDNLGDSFRAVAISIGTDLLPALNNASDAMLVNLSDYEKFKDANNDLVEFMNYPISTILKWTLGIADSSKETSTATRGYIAMARAMAIATDATNANAQAAAEEAVALEAMQKNIESLNSKQLSATGSMQSSFESYNESYQQISGDLTLTDDERIAKLDELATEHEKDGKRMILSMLEQQLSADGLQSHELEALLQMGVGWGIYSQEVVDETRKAMVQAELLKKKIDDIPTEKAFKLTMSYQNNIGSYYSNLNYGGQKAAGGPVSMGEAYIVGEKGPEWFVPNESGTIIPNGGGASMSGGAAGGNSIVVNFTYAPGIGTADPAQVEQLAPIITNIVRRAYIGGQLGG